MSARLAPATLAAVAVFSAIWGYNWVVMKQALAYAGPFDFAALRHLFGTAALFAMMIGLRRPLRPRATGSTIILGLLQTGLFAGLIMAALAAGGAGRTAVLTYTMPFWSLLLSRLFLDERLARMQWPAVALAACGLACIFVGAEPGGTPLAGVLAVSAGLAWAMSAILAKRLRARIELDLLSLTAWQMLFGSLALAAAASMTPSRAIDWSPYFVFALVFNVVFATALAWYLWLFVLNRLPAGIAALATLAIPVIGVLSAWIELGERPSSLELAGMVAIGAGLLLLARAGAPRRGG